MISRNIKVLFLALLILSLVGCSANKDEYVNVGTAGTGGAYYPIGIAISEILTKDLGVNSTAQVTGGAVENVTLVNKGATEIAITQSPMAYAGFNGTAPYESKNDNIATLFNGLSKGVFQLVVSESSGINSVADLKGKKVVLGPSGGGAINVITDILSVYNFSLADIQPTYVSYSEGVSMLSDNNVDAVIVQSAAPAAAIKELEASGKKFELISIEPEKINQLLEKFAYLDQITLPKDMYGTNQDIKTVYLTNMMIVKKDLDEDMVYKITKAIFENIEKVKESHPAAKGFSLEEAVTRTPIPLHPGAAKYFKEVGVLK
ncbi:TAXI family TRAP transporter solute-binding subunit [Desulfoscipio geothermicus]|nr:TAXI family TRAP transporter solute-binding subunit [Desulfoscipio geothermicus]